ncbi:hypothetical protein Daus18300_013882 [Diaporthe australafricana]|uniref:Uncharacterized protein n=1 Tax=Diaporthe australafricana TaxID=127596 RepID=A0ABR3VXF5_9PEZI
MISDIRVGDYNGNGFKYVGFVPSYVSVSDDEPDIRASSLQGLNDTLLDRNGASQPNVDYVSTDYARLFFGLPGHGTQLIECGLYNSSFQVNFTFTDGQQDIQVIKTARLNGVNAQNSQTHDCGDDLESRPPQSCYAANTIYVSILEALGPYLVGRIDFDHYGFFYPVRTQIMSSIFMQTQELHDIFAEEEPLSIANLSMAAALEQVFTNVTLIIVGLFCIATADSRTFDTLFSTVLRTTRDAELNAAVTPSESAGDRPLSKNLARTRLRLLNYARVTGEDKNGSDVCARRAGVGTSFMVVNGGGSLDQCSEASAQQDVEQAAMSMTDVDSLLLPDEGSYPSPCADTSTSEVEDSSVIEGR